MLIKKAILGFVLYVGIYNKYTGLSLFVLYIHIKPR